MIEFLKKYSIYVVISIAILLAIISLMSPFKPEVWGNVADWCMVLVTIVTAVFLIKTFNEQKLANKIEMNKRTIAIQPKFEVRSTVAWNNIDSGNRKEFYIKIILKENDVRDYSFDVISENVREKALVKPYLTEGCEECIYLINKFKPFEIDEIHKIAVLKFMDIDYNSYSQVLYIQNGFLALKAPDNINTCLIT